MKSRRKTRRNHVHKKKLPKKENFSARVTDAAVGTIAKVANLLRQTHDTSTGKTGIGLAKEKRIYISQVIEETKEFFSALMERYRSTDVKLRDEALRFACQAELAMAKRYIYH